MFLQLSDSRVPAEWRTSPDVQRLTAQGSRPFLHDDGTLGLLTTKTERLSVGVQHALPHAMERLERLETEHAPAVAPRQTWAPPDPERLHRMLSVRFPNGGTRCGPLNRLHHRGVPFLAGYATVWDVPFLNNRGENLIMRRGAFRAVLNSGDDVEAWVNHFGDMRLASRKANSLAIEEDDYGLAVFVDPSGWKYGDALAAAINRGELSQMSFRLAPSQVDTFASGGRTYKEILSVGELLEVSFVNRGRNRHTTAITFNADRSYLDTSGGQCKLGWLLLQAGRGETL